MSTLSTVVFLEPQTLGMLEAGRWTNHCMCMFKPLKGSLHQNPGIYFFKRRRKNYVRVGKRGKDAMADSLSLCAPLLPVYLLPARY